MLYTSIRSALLLLLLSALANAAGPLASSMKNPAVESGRGLRVHLPVESEKLNPALVCSKCRLVVGGVRDLVLEAKQPVLDQLLNGFCQAVPIPSAIEALRPLCNSTGRTLIRQFIEGERANADETQICQELALCDRPQCYAPFATGVNGGCYSFEGYYSYPAAESVCASEGAKVCSLDESLRWIPHSELVDLQTRINSEISDVGLNAGVRWLRNYAEMGFFATPTDGLRVTGSWQGIKEGSDPLFQLAIAEWGGIQITPHFQFATQDTYYSSFKIVSNQGPQRAATVCCRPEWVQY
jgi:hypothetical protein